MFTYINLNKFIRMVIIQNFNAFHIAGITQVGEKHICKLLYRISINFLKEDFTYTIIISVVVQQCRITF